MPIPVAERSKAWGCSRSLAGIAGSNPAGGLDVFPLWVLCVLSGRDLCDGLITRPEESYRLWCVLVCDLGTWRMRRLKRVRVVKCRIEKKCLKSAQIIVVRFVCAALHTAVCALLFQQRVTFVDIHLHTNAQNQIFPSSVRCYISLWLVQYLNNDR